MGVLDWMAAELRAAGLTVVEYPGWRDRRTSGSFAPRGVIWHHDASAVGPSPSMAKLIAEIGNATTPPPLSQCWVDTAGRWHLIASGRANHAGIGDGWGRIRANQGNEDAIGIETDHTTGEAWPAALLQSLRRGTAVLLRHLGASASNSLAGHKEYAPARKVDPAGLDMAAERRAVAAVNLEENDMDINDLRNWKPTDGSWKVGGDGTFEHWVAYVWQMLDDIPAVKAAADAAKAEAAAARKENGALSAKLDTISEQIEFSVAETVTRYFQNNPPTVSVDNAAIAAAVVAEFKKEGN